MTRSVLVAIIAVSLVGVLAAGESAPNLVGRWQYIQPPDSEGEVLDISVANGQLKGIMNGLERTGEHGLFYYVVEVSNLAVSSDGGVRFSVGERTLFSKRPALSKLGVEGESGVFRDAMDFEGRIEGSDLVLKCSGGAGSCPDSTIRFKRIDSPRPAPCFLPWSAGD